jgi:hypothetical protein
VIRYVFYWILNLRLAILDTKIMGFEGSSCCIRL